MTEPFDYVAEGNRVSVFVRALMDLRLVEILELVSRTDTIAPIFDPTAWIRGEQNLRDMEEIVRPLLEAQRNLRPVLAEMEARIK